MIILKVALEQEKKETQEMLSIYHRYTKHQATKAEIREANKQFADILKGLSLSIFVILPFAPVTIPILIKVAKRVGVDLLPSAFNHDVKKIENKKKE